MTSEAGTLPYKAPTSINDCVNWLSSLFSTKQQGRCPAATTATVLIFVVATIQYIDILPHHDTLGSDAVSIHI